MKWGEDSPDAGQSYNYVYLWNSRMYNVNSVCDFLQVNKQTYQYSLPN